MKKDDSVDQTFLQITDLVSYVSLSDTKTLIWINDVATNSPETKAKINLIDSTSSYTTDDDGVAYVDTLEGLKSSKENLFFKVTAIDGKSSVIPIERGNSWSYYYAKPDWSWYDSATREKDNYWTYFYLDRNMYLPTDSIKYWGIIKNRDNPQPSENFKLEITKSGYYNYYQEPVIIAQQDIKTSSLGTFEGEYVYKNLTTGYYTINIYKGEESIVSSGFYVEPYVKPAYTLSVESSKRAYFTDETLEFTGTTSFFEGTPVSDMSLKYSNLAQGEIKSDINGDFRISANVAYEEENFSSNHYPDSENIMVTNANAEEGSISSYENVLIFGPKLYMKTSTKQEENIATITVQMNHISLDRINNGKAEDSNDFLGEPAIDQEISGTLYEKHTEKIPDGQYYDFINKKVETTYRYNTVVDSTKDFTIKTDTDGLATYTLSLKENKFYTLDFQSADIDGKKVKRQVGVYATTSYSGYSGNSQSYDRYSLRTNNEGIYKIGDEVKLTMVNGSEKIENIEKHFLFMISQRGIRDYGVRNTAEYSFEFKSSDIPNLIATGVYFDGKTIYKTYSVLLDFNKNVKDLDISISPDKERYQPGETVNLEVQVNDLNGQGKEAEVNVNLIDEAYYAMGDTSSYVDSLSNLYETVYSGIWKTYTSHQYPISGAERGAACFLEGTKILLSDENIKNIEEIEVGDTILTKIDPYSLELVEATVTETFVHEVSEYLLINDFLHVTSEHVMFVNNKWTTAGDIKTGDILKDKDNQNIVVKSVRKINGHFKVYNFKVENYSTYFADSIYVHNSKGRDYFADRAFFGSVHTDANGYGQVSFKLPDNITSWRATYQGITSEIQAGSGYIVIPASLPFFVDMVIPQQILEGDKPIIKMRSYGVDLQENQDVIYKITVESLGIKDYELSGKSFAAVDYQLGVLPLGINQIIIEGTTDELTDKITRSIEVISSRLTKDETKFYELSEGLKIEGSEGGITTLVFSNKDVADVYSELNNLSYVSGDRLDQILARNESRKLINEYFKENREVEEIEESIYQTPNGGLAIFPYSDQDLALSVKTSFLYQDYFDKNSLREYFYSVYNNKEEGRERSIMALCGLASFREPVLVALQNMSLIEDLTPKEKIYVGLGLAVIGDKEGARKLYKDIIEEYGEDYKPYVRIKVGEDEDDILELTSLMADFSYLLDEIHQEALFKYVKDSESTDILTFIEQLLYLTHKLRSINPDKVSFTYVLQGQEVTKELQKDELFRLGLSVTDLNNIEFKNIIGNVGVVSQYEAAFNPSSVIVDTNLKLSRSYGTGNSTTTEFLENNLVKITLSPKFDKQALQGCYQVTDYLPAGLKVISGRSYYSYSLYDEYNHVWYPYDVDGQIVNFCVYKDSKYLPIVYFARISSKGEYKAESATIQSQRSNDAFNFSSEAIVKIK